MMTDMAKTAFVETREHKRFLEFCNECRRNRHIGLCYGPPGVGKTLSARRYAHWDEIEPLPRFANADTLVSDKVLWADTVFYTAPVANSPGRIDNDLRHWRDKLRMLSRTSKDIVEEAEILLRDARLREQKEKEEFFSHCDWRVKSFWDFPRSEPTVEQVVMERHKRHETIKDPTQLIIIDEADRLKIQSLEQVRSIFDRGGVSVILIGMPSMEKQLARYPQLYSRIGFAHEYGLLSAQSVRSLLHDKWLPPDILLPETAFGDEEGVAAIIRITQGNFRRLFMLLMQIARILELNPDQARVDREVVTAARASLVIGLD
jgi:DNA transposition AAA+ family ATPase